MKKHTVKERSIIMALLRRASQKWLPRWAVTAKARVERGRYMCKKCSNIVTSKEFQVDHIKPVIPVSGFDSWDGVIARLFCHEEGMQVLCKPCHKDKSNKENKKR